MIAFALGGGAIFLLINGFPAILPLMMGAVGIYLLSTSNAKGTCTEVFVEKYKSVSEKLNGRIRYLQTNAPAAAVQTTQANILGKIDEYKTLVSAFKSVAVDYDSTRKQQQLDAHLSAYSIRGARIPKLKSGDVASLASYGFTTAFDAARRNVQDAYGIGPVKSASIMAWVKQVKAKFHFRS